MPREEDRDRAEKTPLVHDIVQDLIRGEASPLKSTDPGIRHILRELYILDLDTLRFLHRKHNEVEKEIGQ